MESEIKTHQHKLPPSLQSGKLAVVQSCMKPSRQYATATAFRVALETRLQAIAQAEDMDFQRFRRQVSYDPAGAAFRGSKCPLAAERRLCDGTAISNRTHDQRY